VRKARGGKLTVDDFAGTTISLTNPGASARPLGAAAHAGPGRDRRRRGAMDYPAEWQGSLGRDPHRNGVSKILTLTSTYDHRIIQGAQSGEFLRRSSTACCSGEDGFYDEIFARLRIPYEPIRWAQDVSATTTTT
jgi:2-oxoglutarate dehydrogenase E1 component